MRRADLRVDPACSRQFACPRALTAGSEDNEPARTLHRPVAPKLLTAATLGFAGNEAAKAQAYGTELALRLDLEATDPLWLSAAGRVILSTPSPQPTADLRAGYQLAFYGDRYVPSLPQKDRVRAFFRPFAGIRPMRFADSPTLASSMTVYPLEAGIDWSVIMRQRAGQNRVWRAFLVALYDTSLREGGLEVDSTWGIGLSERSLGGPFVGGRIGYLPRSGASGGLHIGIHYELRHRQAYHRRADQHDAKQPFAPPLRRREKEVVAGLAVQTTDPASRRGTFYTKLRSHWNRRPW